MMGKIIGCVTLFLFGAGVMQADEIVVSIKKVDGNKITYTKVMKGKKNKNTPAEEVTVTATSDVKVMKGTYDKKAKSFTAGDAIEGGLSSKTFSSGKTFARITTDDTGKVTQVLVADKGKKKKKSTTSDE